MRKKMYVTANSGQKIFTVVEPSFTGELFVTYFIPKSLNFCINPINKNTAKLSEIVCSKDNRTMMVRIKVHPVMILGKSYDDKEYHIVEDVMSEIFNRFIEIREL